MGADTTMADGNEQVKHMTEFILHEAHEKADEINAKAQADYTCEKQHLVEDEKLRLKKDFERRENNVALDAKIANATEMNKNKLQVLAAASLRSTRCSTPRATNSRSFL